VIFALLFAASVADATPALPSSWSAWKYVRTIDTGTHQGSVAVSVPPSIYVNAQPSLDDLRVVTTSGDVVPFAIVVPPAAAPERWLDATLLDSGTVAGRYSQTVADVGAAHETHRALDVATSLGRFSTTVDVDASDDLRTWRTIRTNAPIYDYRSDGLASNTIVTFPASTARYLRLRVALSGVAFPIDGVRVAQLTGAAAPSNRYAITLGPPKHDAKEKTTAYAIDGIALVPVDRFRIDSATAHFARTVDVQRSSNGTDWETVVSQEISRTAPGRDALTLDSGETQGRRWRIVIHDGDDLPLRAVRLDAFGRPRRVDFDAVSGTSYLLVYGNPRADAPSFDYAKTHDAFALVRAPDVRLGGPGVNAAFAPVAEPQKPWTERNAWVLWLALGVAVLGIGGAAIKTMSSPPPAAQ
jgi:hypothetical protein